MFFLHVCKIQKLLEYSLIGIKYVFSLVINMLILSYYVLNLSSYKGSICFCLSLVCSPGCVPRGGQPRFLPALLVQGAMLRGWTVTCVLSEIVFYFQYLGY